jgi:hypothetical protein
MTRTERGKGRHSRIGTTRANTFHDSTIMSRQARYLERRIDSLT